MPAIAHAPALRTRQHEPQRRLKLVSGAQSAVATVRVAVADRHALARAGMRVLLDREAGIVVVGEAATGGQLVALVRRTRPEVVVIDAHLPGSDLVRSTRDILHQPGIAVMVLARDEDDPRILPALRAGARGVLLEDAQPDELVHAVWLLARGETALPERLARDHATAAAGRAGAVIPMPLTSRRQRPHKEQHMFTPRVTEIMRGCAQGQLVRLPRPRPTSLVPGG
jgi:DNA-binding NarL/FixJ family response regulator